MDPRSPLQSRSRSRSRSGSRSRRSDLRHHRSPRSPPIGPGGDSGRGGGGGGRLSSSAGPGRYDDYDSYSRAPIAYRQREPRYPDYRMADPYGGRPAPPMHGAPLVSSGPGSRRSRTRSPLSSRRRHEGDRENPPAGRCIGIFGLSIYTKETDLHEVFSRYGPLEDVQIVYDAQSGRSRGFAFVYFQNVADAAEAKDRCNGMDIDGRKIRVDFSLTQRAHTPTPGVYMGKAHPRGPNPPTSQSYSRSNSSVGGYNNPYPHPRSNHHMLNHHHQQHHQHYPSRTRYNPHYPPAMPPVEYERRPVTRSRSASPRKFYY